MTTPVLADVEPIERTVKRYICPFCSRGRSKRSATVEHIGRCWLNPAVRSCKTCVHYVPDWSEPEVGYFTSEYCSADVELPTVAGEMPLTNCEKWELEA